MKNELISIGTIFSADSKYTPGCKVYKVVEHHPKNKEQIWFKGYDLETKVFDKHCYTYMNSIITEAFKNNIWTIVEEPINDNYPIF